MKFIKCHNAVRRLQDACLFILSSFGECHWVVILRSLVSCQTVDEVLVKVGSTGCILPGIIPCSSDPDSAAVTQV